MAKEQNKPFSHFEESKRPENGQKSDSTVIDKKHNLRSTALKGEWTCPECGNDNAYSDNPDECDMCEFANPFKDEKKEVTFSIETPKTP